MITIPLAAEDASLVLSDAVMEHFSLNQQVRPDQAEAGGQLFARITRYEIFVEEATGPRPTDRAAGPTTLQTGRRSARRFASGLLSDCTMSEIGILIPNVWRHRRPLIASRSVTAAAVRRTSSRVSFSSWLGMEVSPNACISRSMMEARRRVLLAACVHGGQGMRPAWCT